MTLPAERIKQWECKQKGLSEFFYAFLGTSFKQLIILLQCVYLKLFLLPAEKNKTMGM